MRADFDRTVSIVIHVAFAVLGAMALLACDATQPAPKDAIADSGTRPGVDASAGEDSKSLAFLVANDPALASARRMIHEGRHTFRYDTFGDEAFWGDALQLHQALQGSAHGGVGPGVSPTTALEVGLKVDVDALPRSVVRAIRAGTIDLTSVDTTLTLLRANAVVGVTGFFDAAKEHLVSVGIQCALCHSTVDNSLGPGIGKRLDGWPNRDLNVGAIINLAPDLTAFANVLDVPEATVRQVLQSWGPGKFDAALILDGKAFREDGASGATLLPAAFGLSGVNLHTYTGWGSVTYWNAFVANLEMHGQGTFYDPRLRDADRFPIAASNGFDDVRAENDRITPKLAALNFYQLALEPPRPPAGYFDPKAARRGRDVFNGAALCSTCHVPPLFTEPGWNLHTADEIGIDDFQAQRSPEARYRTTPLRGLFTRETGGFYHDGRFATLIDVVNHYDQAFALALSTEQREDLVQYLRSL